VTSNLRSPRDRSVPNRELFLTWIRAENARVRAAEVHFQSQVIYSRVMRTAEELKRRRAGRSRPKDEIAWIASRHPGDAPR
jgi:hypothetical protein